MFDLRPPIIIKASMRCEPDELRLTLAEWIRCLDIEATNGNPVTLAAIFSGRSMARVKSSRTLAKEIGVSHATVLRARAAMGNGGRQLWAAGTNGTNVPNVPRGEWNGQRVPSRILADYLGVSHSTVIRARRETP